MQTIVAGKFTQSYTCSRIIFMWYIHIICLWRKERVHTYSFKACVLRMCVCVCTCVYMYVRAYAQASEWSECGATPELNHVRNGWWARLGGRTSQFYGTMVLRAHLAHRLSSNIPPSSYRVGQEKGSRIPLVSSHWLYLHAPGSDDEPDIMLRAFLQASVYRASFLISLREFLVAMVGRPLWFYTMKVFREGPFVRLVCAAFVESFAHAPSE